MSRAVADSPADLGRLRVGAWAVFAAFVIHNIEEAATMGWFLDRSASTGSGLAAFRAASAETFLVAVGIVTLIGLGLTLAGTTGGGGQGRPWWSAVLAAVMLVNVAVPHVPAAIAAGGYAPGLVTALALNLPVDAWYLRRLVRAGRLDRRGAVAAFVAGGVLLGAALPLIHRVAGAVAG